MRRVVGELGRCHLLAAEFLFWICRVGLARSAGLWSMDGYWTREIVSIQ